jgi:hypothetical protein
MHLQDGRTPLDLARANIENKEAEMMAAVEAVLSEHGAKEQRGGKHSLRSAAEKGILEEVVARIKEGADVNERNRVRLNCAAVSNTSPTATRRTRIYGKYIHLGEGEGVKIAYAKKCTLAVH